MEAVKNHTVYRRDNFIRNLSNQTKSSFNPYLRFQIKEKKDPFESRPLSSALKRADAMYPSRQTALRAHRTEGGGIAQPAKTVIHSGRVSLRKGTR